MRSITLLDFIWNDKDYIELRIINQVVQWVVQPFYSCPIINVISIAITPPSKPEPGSFVIESKSHSLVNNNPSTNLLDLKIHPLPTSLVCVNVI